MVADIGDSHLRQATPSLVDAFFTVAQADAPVDWVAASCTNLTTIYATHGHGDYHPLNIEETRQYIRDFDQIAETAQTALELYEGMLARHAPPR